jgi:hypothetical protein
MLGKKYTKVFDHIFSHRLTLKFSGDHSLTPCIKQSRVSYAIYNSRTAGQIFMIFILLDLSSPRLAE